LPAETVSCPAVRGATKLVLARPAVIADDVVAVFDAGDPLAPKVLCVLRVFAPRFFSATEIEYARPLSPGVEVVRRDLLTGSERVVVEGGQLGFFGPAGYAWSPDGKTLVYLAPTAPTPAGGCPCAGNSIHLLAGGSDRVLAYLGEIPARGFLPHGGDQIALFFSPSGTKFVVVDTVSGSGTPRSEHRSLRVYSLDGTALFETSGAMPVWVGERLFFGECNTGTPAGCVNSWDGGTVAPVLPGVRWEEPVASPDATTIAFTRWDDECLACVVLLDTQTNATRTLGRLRSRPVWASSTVLWWSEEELCAAPNCNFLSATNPTDRVSAVRVASGAETAVPFAFVYDVWPKVR
jgi:WD40 repeat protein